MPNYEPVEIAKRQVADDSDTWWRYEKAISQCNVQTKFRWFDYLWRNLLISL